MYKSCSKEAHREWAQADCIIEADLKEVAWKRRAYDMEAYLGPEVVSIFSRFASDS